MIYSPESPFNQPIPEGVKIDANSSQVAARIAADNKTTNPFKLYLGRHAAATYGYDYNHPLFAAKDTDPEYVIAPLLRGWGKGLPEIVGHRIKVPIRARPAQGSDYHLSVLQPDGKTVYHFWECQPPKDGKIVAGHGGRSDRTTDGLKSAGCAANWALDLGIIFPDEYLSAAMNYPEYPIPHALFLVTYYYSGLVAPAYIGGGPKRLRNEPSIPKLGGRLFLDITDAELNTKPRHLKPILACMRDYGLIVGDTGGGSLKVDSSNPEAWECAGLLSGAPRDSRLNYTWDLRGAVDWATKLKAVA